MTKRAAARPATPASRDEEYDLRDIFKVLRRRLGVISITVLVVTVSAGLVALNLTPRYTASSTIVVEPRETRIIFDEEQRDVPEDISTINTHVKFLTSNSFAKKVIQRLNLVRDAEFHPVLRQEIASGGPVLSRVGSSAELPLTAIDLTNQAPSTASDPLPTFAPPARDRPNALSSAPQIEIEALTPPTEAPPAATPPAAPPVPRVAGGIEVEPMDATVVATRNVNVRPAPDTVGDPLGLVAQGTEVAVVGKVIGADWYQIERPDGGRAYVHAPLFVRSSRSTAATDEPALAPAAAPAPPQAAQALQPAEPVQATYAAPSTIGAPANRAGSPISAHDAYDPVLEEVTEAFLGQLEVDPSGQSYAITIAFTSVNPETAARVANTMAELYVEHQLEAKQAATTGALDWLVYRLDELREQLVRSERAAEQFRAENELVVGAEGFGFSDEELMALTQELISAQAERVSTEAKLDRIRQVRGSRESLDSIPEVMMSPIIADLRQQEMEILRTEAQLRQEYGPRHPALLQIQADGDKIAARLDAETRNIIASLANQVATIQVREQTLQERLARANAAAAADSQAEIQLRLLEGEAESTRTLYTTLLDRFKELTAERELLEPGVQVISTAAIPATPTAPQVKLITGAGFMGSLMLGTLLALVLDRLDRGLRTGRQAEEVLDVAHIGLIPKLGNLMNGYGACRYLVEKPTSAYAEAIRGVQTALYFSKLNQPAQVVLVTSSLPGEGKTTLALSLATLLAQSGSRTVAVDLDLRRPQLGYAAREERGGDLVEHLRGEKRLDDILHGVHHLRTLEIVPCRRPAGSPTDLLASQRMASFMAELRARYDYIILDSPPLLGMSDAQLAARLADAVLFVVRWSKTGEEVARKALDTVRNSGAPIAGVVLTQVNVRRHRMYSPEDVLQYYGKYKKHYQG